MRNGLKTTLTSAAVAYLVAGSGLGAADSSQSAAPVEKTGQATSYAAGDDGALEWGVDWPTPRFTDNGDGTVSDNLTGLVWTEDARCFDGKYWDHALDRCNNLESGGCGLSDGSIVGDWRLPNIRELLSLVDMGEYDPVLPKGHPFSNVFLHYYWASTTQMPPLTGDSWCVDFSTGLVTHSNQSGNYSVWCVRDESKKRAAASSWQGAPVDKTGQTASMGTRDDGDLQRGVAWPVPRFTDGGDGTVTDNLTGLVWMDDGACLGQELWPDALSVCNTLASGSCDLSDGSSPGDWRLPNRKELLSLAHLGHFNPGLPDTAGPGHWTAGDPFAHLILTWYWSSTTFAENPDNAWMVDIYWAILSHYDNKIADHYVWCVRGGATPLSELIRPSSGSESCPACIDGIPPDPGLRAGYERFTIRDPEPDLYEDYITLEGRSGSGVTLAIRTVLKQLSSGVYAINPDGGGSGPPDGYWEYSLTSQDGKTDGVTAPALPLGEKVTKIWQFADEGGGAFDFWVDVYTGVTKGETWLGQFKFSPGSWERGSRVREAGDDFILDDGTPEIHAGATTGALIVANRFSTSNPVSLRAVSFYTSGEAAGDPSEVIIYEDSTGTAPGPDPTMEVWRTTVVLEDGGFQEALTGGCPTLNSVGSPGAAFYVAVANTADRSYTLGIDMTGPYAEASHISTDGEITFTKISTMPIIDGNAMIRVHAKPAESCFIGAVMD